MNTPYHYTESGLDNVYLYNISVIQDVEGEQTICIPHVNELHKVIAKALLQKRGELTGKEIRFLRTYVLFSQAELASLIGKDGQTIGRWERGECPIDKSMDMLVRIAIAQKMDIPAILANLSHITSLQASNDNIKIDGSNNQYTLMAA
jgi:DNA-binding transcriptional regulator YiaG